MTSKADIPSLKEFFLAHGAATGKPRVIKPYLGECFRYVNLWMLGRLPDGKRNLSINIPPRHGKTFLARDIIAYSMGLWPDSEFIYVSYAAKLAVEQTKAIRFTMNSQWYQTIWPWVGELTGQQDHYATKYGGKVFGVGMDGPITGMGAGQKREEFGGAIIIDDILKASDARSEVERKKANEWYTGALLSRKNHDRTPILNISQRLHPDDLVGHLKANEAENWYFLETPAVDEEVQTTIWPDTFSYTSAMKLKAMDEFAYYSQYQQQPIIPGGSLIKAEWWSYFDEPVNEIKRKCQSLLIFADTAYTAKNASDYSVLGLFGLTPENLYILDLVRGRWQYEELLQQTIKFWEKHSDRGKHQEIKPVHRLYIEDKASGLGLLGQPKLFRKHGINAFPWNSKKFVRDGDTTGDKVARVNQAKLSIYDGRVLLPSDMLVRWVEDLIAETSAFNAEMTQSHDDITDVVTMGILTWEALMEGRY